MSVSPSATNAATAAAMRMRWSASGSTCVPSAGMVRAPGSRPSFPRCPPPWPLRNFTVAAIRSLSLYRTCSALMMVLTPSAWLATTATMGNRSGASARSTSMPWSDDEPTETVPSLCSTTAPKRPRMSTNDRSPWRSRGSRLVTVARPASAPAASGNAAEEKSPGPGSPGPVALATGHVEGPVSLRALRPETRHHVHGDLDVRPGLELGRDVDVRVDVLER